MKLFLLLISIFLSTILADVKNVHIIYGKSSHGKDAHNNTEVAKLIKYKLERSKYTDKFNVTMSFHYPKDESLVENADLLILSCDGGDRHALAVKNDLTRDTKKIDAIMKKKKTGLIVIHWATDAPSEGMGKYHTENDAMFIDWIGAVYCWGCDHKKHLPCKSWTLKPVPLKVKTNKDHPIANGVDPEFDFMDEVYLNFFTPGADSRNPKTDKVTYIHKALTPRHKSDIKNKEKWTEQSFYWCFTRENEGRSVAMTSAHYYKTWTDRNFFQTFSNSIFWTLNMEICKEGVDIPTPTQMELDQMRK
ncbi:ThuA domain-containing protein [Lentisphaera marina]|uniref:ThuA domain-containing protein n=1 Tax=Lentisphaera marina TaxID=1111041 RepID=UPI0023665776|nr:ThuA domain-containing protein [Lentisphaera marina]MDD7984896.1 ThuA domain-containing protein [Lentisphaera marina]